MSVGDRVAAAARRCIGVRFRPHGRDVAHGLDCVGVAAVALREGGVPVAAPDGYSLRTTIWSGATPPGLVACDGTAVGDVLLCQGSAGQLHVAIRTGGGIVHADATLRRVVERPGAVPWPVERAWRPVASDGEGER